MFVNVAHIPSLVACRATNWAHTEPGDDERFRVLSQADFIRYQMSEEGRAQLLGAVSGDYSQAIEEMANKWISQTSIASRIFFDGPTQDLAALVAKKCLIQADVSPASLDAIVGGTNTGPGYPSLADYVKLSLGQSDAQTMCFDTTEACTVGAVSIFLAWNLVRSATCRRVLVVCAEKATSLTHPDNWKGANLFGDKAFAVLLQSSEVDSFRFFDFDSLPFDGKIDKVVKTKEGFSQDGLAVHKFVGSTVVERLVSALNLAGIEPADIDHLVPHQPSGKTLDLLERKLQGAWPAFSGHFHRNVEYTGNTSGASTGSIISQAIGQGAMKPGELVLVSTFGGGLSIGSYAFTV